MASTEEKVVLITGASRGMGAGIAKEFSKQGVCLSLVAIDDDTFDAEIEKCKEIGAHQVLKIVTDLTKKENVEMVIDQTISKFGRLDVLVNNAGITCSGTVENIKLEDFEATLKINTIAPLYMIQRAIPHLEKTKGNVVNISSIYSKMCVVPSLLGYNISKAALDNLTRVSALDLAKKGIRVNAVSPTACDTPILKDVAKMEKVDLETIKESLGALHPLGGKLLQVQNVADAVSFLSSEKACMITGVNLPVDCGRLVAGK